MSFIGQLFGELLLQNMNLLKYLTGLVSENFSEVNVLPRPKNSSNLQKSTFSNFFIIRIKIELAKAIFNEIWDLRTAS